MTIQEFAEKYNIKSTRTIINWLESKYIPGAIINEEEWIIPNLARPPYTGTRATTDIGIYKSIVRGANEHKHVFAALYKMEEQEFQIYINQLTKMEFITTIEEDGIVYYRVTPKAEEYLSNKKIDYILKTLVSAGLQVAMSLLT